MSIPLTYRHPPKLLRGDKPDNIPDIPKYMWTAKDEYVFDLTGKLPDGTILPTKYGVTA